MEYSMVHQKTIDELGEMAKKCTSMKELNDVMKKARQELN